MRNRRLAEILGQAIHDLRLERDLTQEGLAELAGCDRAYLSAVECARKAISMELLIAILDSLDVMPTDFFSRIESLRDAI